MSDYTDLQVARKLIQLSDSAKSRKLDFNLGLTDVKRLLSRKRCAYTGMVLTKAEPNQKLKRSDRTIDRIDSTKGYVKGNVIAVSHLANQLKNHLFELEGSPLSADLKEVRKFVNALDKLGVK